MNIKLAHKALLSALAMAALFSLAPAHAWEPTKTVEFIVPAGTGGGADQMARFIQSVIAKNNLMKQSMVVVNKGGGAGAEGFLDMKGAKGHAFWVHSAAVGMLARQIWKEVGSGPLSSDDLYVAGLLHDAGLLVLEQFFPREYAKVLEARAVSGARLWQVEEQDLGMDHGAVGGLLLGRWSLPQALVEAVTNHHHPHQANEEFQSVCRVVQAAEVLCTEHGAAMTQEGPADCSPEDVLTEVGLDEAGIRRVLAEVPSIAVRAAQFLA